MPRRRPRKSQDECFILPLEPVGNGPEDHDSCYFGDGCVNTLRSHRDHFFHPQPESADLRFFSLFSDILEYGDVDHAHSARGESADPNPDPRPTVAENADPNPRKSKAAPREKRSKCIWVPKCDVKTEQHRRNRVHPGDADWTGKVPEWDKSKRYPCPRRDNRQCETMTRPKNHLSNFCHVGDEDWVELKERPILPPNEARAAEKYTAARAESEIGAPAAAAASNPQAAPAPSDQRRKKGRAAGKAETVSNPRNETAPIGNETALLRPKCILKPCIYFHFAEHRDAWSHRGDEDYHKVGSRMKVPPPTEIPPVEVLTADGPRRSCGYVPCKYFHILEHRREWAHKGDPDFERAERQSRQPPPAEEYYEEDDHDDDSVSIEDMEAPPPRNFQQENNRQPQPRRDSNNSNNDRGSNRHQPRGTSGNSNPRRPQRNDYHDGGARGDSSGGMARGPPRSNGPPQAHRGRERNSGPPLPSLPPRSLSAEPGDASKHVERFSCRYRPDVCKKYGLADHHRAFSHEGESDWRAPRIL